MKILHIGLTVNGRGEGLSKAFRQASELYAEFPPNRNLPHQINSLGWVPDLVFLQIQDDKIRNGRDSFHTCDLLGPSMDRLKNQGAFIINWTGDKRNDTPSWMFNFAKHVSITCFSNEEDVLAMKVYRMPSLFLQIGIDPEVFNNSYPKIEVPDMIFMGNNHGRYPLSQQRINYISFLQREFGDKFAIYGNGYPGVKENLNANGSDPFPMQSRESQIYGSCKIGISISHYDSDRYTSDRLLRIMGSGCFALSHHYRGIEKDFEIGKHLDTFRDQNDLKDKINHYLSNESAREGIAKNGYDLIHSRHTYKNMVEDMIKLKKTE